MCDMRRRVTPALVLILTALSGCVPRTQAGQRAAIGQVSVSAEGLPYGTLADGRQVHAYTLANRNGMTVRVIDYGATIISLRVPGRDAAMDDVVLGFDSLSGYAGVRRHIGAVVGRYGNRIRNGQFTIDGRSDQLARNNGPNHLHGGVQGFDRVIWQARPFQAGDSAGVVLSYTSPDGEENYPGTLKASVTYTLAPDNRLVIDYRATTDAPTHVNLTQHTFFNLAGAGRRDVLDHVLTVNASAYTPVDSTSIPTGEIANVAGTPFDFRSPMPIGARIQADFPQLRRVNGYDHNYVLDRGSERGLVHAVHVLEPVSGRTMDVHTTEPGLQLYTGNNLDGRAIGRDGRSYRRYFGFCLETQHYPDSPNQPQFPSTLLRRGEEYRSRTVFAFGVNR